VIRSRVRHFGLEAPTATRNGCEGLAGNTDGWASIRSNISHVMEPIMATASVTGEVLGTPNAKMKEQLGQGGPKLFTPWLALQDQELVQKD
jgi:hypothetical protein